MFKVAMFHFFEAACSKLLYIFVVEHTYCSNVVNSKVGWEINRCEIVINISNLAVGVKHSIGRRTTFFPNPHSVKEETSECLPIRQH